MPRAEFLQTS